MVSLLFFSCAYFNTFYNAEKYFKEANKMRLEKSGQSIPLRAIDNYGKTIQKCKIVLSDFPESRYVNDAILLMAKAQFYRSEYDEAISNLKIIYNKGNIEQIAEAKYWSAVCKWKKGKTQTAINELKEIIKASSDKNIKAQCHLSLADIFNEIDRNDDFLFHLEEGAKIIIDRAEKGIVYNKLADIAFNNENYAIAEAAYKEVIKNSLAKEKIEDAHIQLLKISRILGDHRSAERKIKSLLIDEKFKNIKGDLEIELVQLYIAQDDIDNAIVRLESIIKEYERTKTSSEAYFLLGQLHLSSIWKPDVAKEKFLLVKKEYNRSEYGPISENKIKAIDGYNKSLEDLLIYESMEADTASKDTVVSDTIINKISKPSASYEELLYHIADIEAFNFGRLDTGIVFFKKILENDSASKYYPKALFALSLLYDDIDDSVNSNKYQMILKSKFPTSDYTSYLNKDNVINKEKRPIELLFSKAEGLWHSNPVLSMNAFKEIMKIDSISELSASAAYFLGYQYDYTFAQIDSAYKYYNWLNMRHPISEQNNLAKSRIKILQQLVTSTKKDSITTVN
ncbi:MAG: hypothetical protein CBD44_03285 [Flavobacteriaceae bacterium TMED184]|nr:MAG: hypothetical protein CBD44_03285 [Flavobacteriaceae bacterium TMED184]|tara:strand:+ start:7688 stop:9388 length:1701 start_codon:yes stop_codon:yes gene_type:complete